MLSRDDLATELYTLSRQHYVKRFAESRGAYRRSWESGNRGKVYDCVAALIDGSLRCAAHHLNPLWRIEADYDDQDRPNALVLSRGVNGYLIYDLAITAKFVQVRDLNGVEVGRAPLSNGGGPVLDLLVDLAPEYFAQDDSAPPSREMMPDVHHAH